MRRSSCTMRKAGRQQVICGQGPAPRGRHHRGIPAAGSRPDPRHRPAAGRGARRVRRLVPAAARLGHLGVRRRCCPSRWAMRGTASIWCRASRQRSRACGHCSRPNGKARPRSTCPAAPCPDRARLFARPALADTWERLCREATGATREARIDAARRAWYQGFVADQVDRFFRGTDVLDVSGRRHRGLLTAEDFRRMVGDGGGSGPSTTTTATAC